MYANEGSPHTHTHTMKNKNTTQPDKSTHVPSDPTTLHPTPSPMPESVPFSSHLHGQAAGRHRKAPSLRLSRQQRLMLRASFAFAASDLASCGTTNLKHEHTPKRQSPYGQPQGKGLPRSCSSLPRTTNNARHCRCPRHPPPRWAPIPSPSLARCVLCTTFVSYVSICLEEAAPSARRTHACISAPIATEIVEKRFLRQRQHEKQLPLHPTTPHPSRTQRPELLQAKSGTIVVSGPYRKRKGNTIREHDPCDKQIFSHYRWSTISRRQTCR